MMTKYSPAKPFAQYKWRWATLTPTESLNRPSVFLGVLRAFQKHEGQAPSTKELQETLQIVENETSSSASLARDTDRNLVRNSGQYWKALGVLATETRGIITLTNFGERVSDGDITQIEFALTVVKSLTLPNSNIETNATVKQWNSIDLQIKPLLLILQIIKALHEISNDECYLNANELINIIIPLSATKTTPDIIASAIYDYRHDKVIIDAWPNCCPEANDKRMAREFILFLEFYHLLKKSSNKKSASAYDENYVLDCISIEEINSIESIEEHNEKTRILDDLLIEDVPFAIERRRVTRDILERPNQAVFRKNILNAYANKCLITGVNISNVLEAAHIIPVSETGIDHISNGICLRTDIHKLYDTGHLKIKAGGDIILSNKALSENNYEFLPNKINLPPFINNDFVNWRNSYL